MRLSPAPDTLWLVRHGQSEANVVRDRAELEGALSFSVEARDPDVGLSELGERQAQAFGRWLGHQPDAPRWVVASPFVRTRQTADHIARAAGWAGDVLVEYDERLRDREMGMLDGLTWAGIVEQHEEESRRAIRVGRYYYRPPGGESWADIMLRLRSVLADLAAAGRERPLLIVTHDVVVQLVRALLTDMSESETVQMIRGNPYANCALARFDRTPSGYAVSAYNDTSPLKAHGQPATKEPDAVSSLG